MELALDPSANSHSSCATNFDDGAQVEGDIVAEQLIIGGRVQGTIHANRVKLNGSAIVEGDIFHRSLSIDVSHNDVGLPLSPIRSRW